MNNDAPIHRHKSFRKLSAHDVSETHKGTTEFPNFSLEVFPGPRVFQPSLQFPTQTCDATSPSAMSALSCWRRLTSPQVKSLAYAQVTGFRAFSTSRSPQTTYGFIGLGQMGFRMAKNLRAKIPAEDSLVVFDVNKAAASQFLQEAEQSKDGRIGTTSLADDVRQLAEQSVRVPFMIFRPALPL